MDKLVYSKKQINHAGEVIANSNIKKVDKKYIEIIESWRAFHAYPMNLLATKLKKLLSGRKDVVIAQRLKRLDTIINKLSRFPDMKLSRMQDLGGCRVILSTVEEVYSFRNMIVDMNDEFRLHSEKDYISTPNPDTGYRGIHLIFKYNSPEADKDIFIELQIRTKLQHLWATAVESVGMFTDNGLKFNQGEQTWIEFFKLSSIVFAEEEISKIDNFNDVHQHLKNIKSFFDLDEKYKLTQKLYAFASAKIIFDKALTNAKTGYYLLQLNLKKGVLNIQYYNNNKKSLKTALKDYSEMEINKTSDMDVVLVSTKSMNALQAAYPNYFVNISEFTEHITTHIDEQLLKCREITQQARNTLLPNIDNK